MKTCFEDSKENTRNSFLYELTGHDDPNALTNALVEWPVDSVMISVNPVEGALHSFLDKTLPAARLVT